MPTADSQPKKPNLKQVGVVAVAVAAVAVAGLLCWWPWHKPSSPDSNTPTLQHSISSSALKQPGSIFTNTIGMEMVYVPPGEFMLGSTPEERARARTMGATETQVDNEGQQPRRSRIRQGFWLGRTELTVGQWQQFVNDAHYQSDAITGFAILDSYPEKRPADHPVAWVTWRDAVAFCDWLTLREQRANRLPERCIYRLPSEAEWEYACRGQRQGTMFWWGDSLADGNGRLNWRANDSGSDSTSSVNACGARGRNGFGLADMLGNVRELCLDAWDPAGAAEVLCADYTRSKARALKGGSFRSPAFDARIARRWSSLYSCGGSDIGFRVSCGINLSNEVARVLQKLVMPKTKSSP
ncbi:MAG: formylglycine-generating enzyme family protein [Verrucomicrobia bacterium]|nr:formylglycine-generating enzyme family protein [Verrucomicrobiota bacterium]